jgi:hypothetical protein
MLMILETSWLIGAPQRYGVDRFANHRCGRYGNRTLIKLGFQNILSGTAIDAIVNSWGVQEGGRRDDDRHVSGCGGRRGAVIASLAARIPDDAAEPAARQWRGEP